MRKGWIEPLTLAAALATACLANGQEPQKKDKDDKPKAKSKLEEYLEQALSHNPDIRVAEAKSREAEAELRRARLLVTQKVAALSQAIDAAKKNIEFAEHDLARLTEQYKAGRVTAAELSVAEKGLLAAKAELAKLEAELPYLLGKASLRPGEAVGKGEVLRVWDLAGHLVEEASDEQRAVEAGLRWLAKQQLPQGPMPERVRKALDTPVTLDFKRKSAAEILKTVFDKAGVPVYIKADLDAEMSLVSKEALPLGAALQLFQDFSESQVQFVLRDYGVLVLDAKGLTQGALTLNDFWKNRPAEKPATRDAPPEDVEGTVKKIDEKSGLIVISIGSDAGLKKGHTLEVFRLKPEAKYLGQVRIVDVAATESVAQPVGKPAGTIQVGDSAASRIRDK
jgi:hypothetical protein